MADPTVVAVIVTYHPELGTVTALLAALGPQVRATVLVDNGSDDETLAALGRLAGASSVELVPLGANLGIGAAQNVGIRRAREHGADHVLLLDHDSLPAPDMVERLLEGIATARARGDRVAAVGPVTTDARNGDAPLVFGPHRWGPRRADVPATSGALVPATFLIASGSLISVDALDGVGPMNEAWFIDHIDLEWGLRATRAGWVLYAVVGAGLGHSLGDRTQAIPGRERAVHIHGPARNYFMARNTVLLIGSGLLPVAWRWGYAAWIVKYMGFYVLAVSPRPRRAALMARGVLDGIRHRTGPLDPSGR